MAMSKKFAKIRNDKRAEMGVGTMIIFIAMVLVAAVAASVLISTANTVREQATQTGNDAITNVASGFDIKYVKGNVEGNAITSMDIYIQLSAGSPALRLSDVTLSITAGSVSGELIFAGAAGPAEGGAADTVKDPAAATSATAPAKYSADIVIPAKDGEPFWEYGTVQQGNLVKVHVEHLGWVPDNMEDKLDPDYVAAHGADLTVSPGAPVLIKIMPAHGTTTTVSFTVPPVLAAGTVNLR